jgi:ribosomal protein S18 acetylase RimI-like enzyme
MKISIRKATAKDYEPLCELFAEIDTLHSDNLPHIFQKTNSAAREKDYYLGLIADEDIGFFVASADEKPIGFVRAIVKDTPGIPIFVPKHYAIIESIVVKSGFQDHGIGSMLMEKAQEWAIAKGAVSMELNVYEFNDTAISFYERLGFKTFSRKMSKELKDKPRDKGD